MHGGATAPPKRTRRRGLGRLMGGLTLVLLVAAAVLLPATVADAQSNAQLRSQIHVLMNQIGSLRGQLADLEKVVHAGAAPQDAAPDAESDVGQAVRNSRRLAELESDIDEAREWRRRVTGRFEEFENAIRRLEGRIERLVADVDFRLSALEGGAAGSPASSDTALASSAPAGEAPAATPEAQTQASIAPEQEAGYETSAAPRTLGTIPAEEGDDPLLLPVGTPEEQYQAAFALLEAAQYEEAHDALTHFIDANSGHPLTQNAAYWRSETLYARQMYAEAARAYALNLRQYPEGRKAPDNMVKLGMALLKLGRSEEACRAFEQLDQAFTDPPLNIRRAAQQGRRQANCP